jgi:hypothetical protein
MIEVEIMKVTFRDLQKKGLMSQIGCPFQQRISVQKVET